MPMGTDIQDTPTPVDPRDAEIANLRAQLAQLQGSVPVASVQAVEAAVKPVEADVAAIAQPVVSQVESDVKSDVSTVEDAVKAEAGNVFTHFIHLADGRVLKLVGTVTHWFDSDNPADAGVPVIGVYPK